ncbi:amino acid ABC transporter substrate-binding protein [Salinibius halmophilus]|uniref:amino acid ABC transporter substrate-binding protein n=1 Tax=Salinibius halmophilus TaxID=1853216 RepID=UPI001F1D24AC|nr:amino acid ABC transporter substrate-binding protein [Salinibius halmophilus]
MRQAVAVLFIGVLSCMLLTGCRDSFTSDNDIPIQDSLDDGGTVAKVRQRGLLKCGVSTGIPGFSDRNQNDRWQGIDVDICRAVAVAVLEDPDAIEFVALNPRNRFLAIKSGEVDLLARNTTWTITRDTAIGLAVAGVNYYDGQSIMVRAGDAAAGVPGLANKTICVQRSTTSDPNLADFFRRLGFAYEPLKLATPEKMIEALEANDCQAISADQSQLFAHRSRLANPEDYQVLDVYISKEPLGPVVRGDDQRWFNIVKWSLFAMINAEELGINMDNVEQMKQSTVPEIRRVLGTEGNIGSYLGLRASWAADIIATVGNYGESFERNLGMASPIGIPRGYNHLWKEGGILYAPPFR